MHRLLTLVRKGSAGHPPGGPALNGSLAQNLPAAVRPTDQILPPPSEYGAEGEEVLAFLWRVLHLDGYDNLPLDSHFRARGGDAAQAPGDHNRTIHREAERA